MGVASCRVGVISHTHLLWRGVESRERSSQRGITVCERDGVPISIQDTCIVANTRGVLNWDRKTVPISWITVEPLIKHTLDKGHVCIKDTF